MYVSVTPPTHPLFIVTTTKYISLLVMKPSFLAATVAANPYELKVHLGDEWHDLRSDQEGVRLSKCRNIKSRNISNNHYFEENNRFCIIFVFFDDFVWYDWVGFWFFGTIW